MKCPFSFVCGKGKINGVRFDVTIMSQGIKLPDVVLIEGGTVLTKEQAAERSSQAQIIFYNYAGAKYAIAVDGRKVTTEAEDNLQAVQLEMADSSGMDTDKAAELAAAGKSKEEIQEALGGGGMKLDGMAALLRKQINAEIEMLVPAVVGCNDPTPENYPNSENLKRGGLLAKVQLQALRDWWNPTEKGSTVEAKTTDNQQSGD